jgi:2-polyprenyl-3-methyl-5-hydroxy-6-metoxy-1,4-benzoquinol methylase
MSGGMTPTCKPQQSTIHASLGVIWDSGVLTQRKSRAVPACHTFGKGDPAMGQGRSRIRILDYGGGNGLLARRLRDVEFANVETYDPFTPEYAKRPDAKFDLITSFETFEHLPNPPSVIDTMVDLLAPGGVALFSTLVQPPEFEQVGMGWWYIGPRNGHVSLFSERALAIAWQRRGFTVSSFDAGTHLAFCEAA